MTRGSKALGVGAVLLGGMAVALTTRWFRDRSHAASSADASDVTWELERGSALATLRGVSAAGYAVGDHGTLLYRTVGAWEPISSGTSADLRAITTAPRALYVAGDHGTILRLAIGTKNATIEPSGTTETLNAVTTFHFGMRAIAGGADGTLLIREDGAWNPMPSSIHETIHGLSQPDFSDVETTEIVYAVGANGIVLRREGDAWALEHVATTEALNAIVLRRKELIILGNHGVILRSDIRSGAWVAVPTGTDDDLVGGCVVRDALVVLGRHGTLLVSVARGAPFTRHAGPPSNATYDLYALSPWSNSVFAAGEKGSVLRVAFGADAKR